MTHDIIILGGGPAGYRAAEQAAKSGLKTLCVEKLNVGGVCLNEGCIPTKTLLYSAKLFDGATHGEKYGVFSEAIKIDHAKVVARKNKVVKLLTGGVKAALKAHGAELIIGEGKIIEKENGEFKVAVGENEYTSKYLLIATGSSPVIPPIPGAKNGVEKGTILTNKEILALTEIPKRLLIIGGGVIGLEMASYFNSIGSAVTVVEMLDHIAGENDAELSLILQKTYAKRGVHFILSTKVVSLENDIAKCDSDGEITEIPFDKALMSVGRRANTADLGLDAIDVLIERGAVITDDHMRTNVENAYAAGDVNGKSMLAHTAYREADVAVNNIIGIEDSVDYSKIPAVIYTNPELGSIGETEDTAVKKNLNYGIVKIPMRFSGRYLAENEGGDGVFKMIINKESKVVLGAQALCNYASEFIVSVGVMMEAKMTVEQIKKVVFPHPTVCEIIREGIDSCEF
ncbi:MAG: dihydrolipoyl dehydrogenase [Clostridia bacterium]